MNFIGIAPILPLSYTTTKFDEFFDGAQPTNDGCNTPTNGTINCGVGTTLMDCNRGSVGDYSNLSDYFVWSSLINPQVSVIVGFGQSVNVHRIIMFLWVFENSDIIVPNVKVHGSNDSFVTRSYEITGTITQSVDNQWTRLNVNISGEISFQYFRVTMNFNNTINLKWIFLSEISFCGKQIIM